MEMASVWMESLHIAAIVTQASLEWSVPEVNINDCVGVNCSGNGQCVDEINSFSCNCNDSYTGPLCETRTHASDNEDETLTIADSKTLHRLVNSIPQMS